MPTEGASGSAALSESRRRSILRLMTVTLFVVAGAIHYQTPMLAATELEAMGFRLGIYPSQTHRAAIRAAQRVLQALKEDGHTTRTEPDLATFQEREDAVGTAEWTGTPLRRVLDEAGIDTKVASTPVASAASARLIAGRSPWAGARPVWRGAQGSWG